MNYELANIIVDNKLQVKNKEGLKNALEQFIKSKPAFVIENEFQAKELRANRVLVNDIANTIDTFRKDTIKDITKQFENDLKELHKIVKSHSDLMKKELDDYKAKTEIKVEEAPAESIVENKSRVKMLNVKLELELNGLQLNVIEQILKADNMKIIVKEIKEIK